MGVFEIVRESLSRKSHDFTRGNLNRSIALLAIPMVIEMSMESVFALCDVYFVSRLGTSSVAAIGIVEGLITLVYALGIGLAVATTATVARRIGEGDPEKAARAAVQSNWLALGAGAALGLGAVIFSSELLELMGADALVVEIGDTYATILLGSQTVILLLFVNNAAFRGAGDASLAMRCLMLANAINLVLDPCLIFGLGPFPELGLTGAAVATTIGRSVGVGYQFLTLYRARGKLNITREQLPPDTAQLVPLARLAIGGFAQHAVAMASWTMLVRIVAGFGNAALAGYTVAIRLIIFALLPSWGLSSAAATLVGQSLGAKRSARAESVVWRIGAYNMVFLGSISLVFVTCSRALLAPFGISDEAMAIGSDALRIISYGFVFYAWELVLSQAFNGAGDTQTPTRINLLCFWAFQIPFAYGLSRMPEYGVHAVFWIGALAYSVAATLALLLFRRGKWKQVSV